MHKLDRETVPAPACLSSYKPGQHNWDDLDPGHKLELKRHLDLFQGRNCAYCEASLDELGCHIEHFRRKHQFPHLTFAWANLFWSCDHPDCCGNHKDRRVKDYDPDDVIDPSKEDPDHFFRFRSDGRIDLKPGLDENERHRAQITLKVFNLDPGRCRLRNLRKLKAKHYLDMNPSLLEALDSFTPEDREEFIREEIEATASEPFWTVVRHLFIDFRSANVP